jgi:signal transduction histidine kinase
MFTNFIDKTTSISYFVFVPLVWAALRFGLRETVTVLFVFSVLAVWSTLLGYGPLTTPNLGAVLLYLNLDAELLYLQGFMSVVAVTSMILATVVAERRELEERKDKFISIASHELKTPLTSLKIRTQLMQKIHADKISQKELEQFEDMDRQIDKITHLINDMLDLSKIQIGKLQLRKESFSLQKLVSESVKSVQETDLKHTIVIVGKADHKVQGDRDRIGQVMINLLSNAIKYSPKANKIFVNMATSGDSVTVSVKDFGIGIPKERINHIFDRFYRAHDYQNVTFSGFGLGLYISSEIVKQHHGRIWVDSEEGKGSTFFVSLPV